MNRFCVAWTVVLGLVSGLARTAEPGASQQIYPTKTLVYATITDVAEFRDRWQASSFGAMQQDPEFAEFFEDIRKQIDAWAGGLAPSAGLKLSQLWQALEGQVAIGLVQTAEGKLSLLATADLGDDPAAAERLISTIEADLAKAGSERMTVQAGDSEIISWTGGQQSGNRFSYSVQGGRLLLSDQLPGVVEAIRRQKDESRETLAANETFQQVGKQASQNGGGSLVHWYANPPALVESLLATNLQGTPQMNLVSRFIDISGLRQFQAVGGTVDLAAGELDSVVTTVGYMPQPVEGLLKAFRLSTSEQAPPDWVPADSALYAQINWSLPTAYEAVSDFYDRFWGAGQFDAAIASLPTGDTGLAVKTDIVEQLVGPVHIMAETPAALEDLTGQPALFALQVRDQRKMAQTLERLSASMGNRMETVDAKGNTVHRLQLASPVPGRTMTLGLSVAEGNLMLSTDAAYLEKVLNERGTRPPLNQSLAYRRVSQHFPPQTSMISYQRPGKDFEKFYEAIRGGTFLPPIPGVAGALDFSKLPRFDTIRRYLQATGSYIEPLPDGFRMVDFALPPREQ